MYDLPQILQDMCMVSFLYLIIRFIAYLIMSRIVIPNLPDNVPKFLSTMRKVLGISLIIPI
jgi:hypothetical protein